MSKTSASSSNNPSTIITTTTNSSGSSSLFASSSQKCPCEYTDEDPTRQEWKPTNCPYCVCQSIQPHVDRNNQALQSHKLAKQECARELLHLQDQYKLAELQAESRLLREKLQGLKSKCAEMAVRVASQAVENDSHKDSHSSSSSGKMMVHDHDHQLTLLQEHFLKTSMTHAIQVATNQVKVLRFCWARRAIAMHGLHIDPNDVKLTHLQKRRQQTQPSQQLSRRPRGIGKIGGLPLPHAGPELYGVLPPRELQSALRLVASVTCTVAQCLGIILPHPILLTPHGSHFRDIAYVNDIANKQQQQQQQQLTTNHFSTTTTTTTQHHPPTLQPPPQSSYNISTSSASSFMTSVSSTGMSLLKRGAKKAYATATGQPSSSSSSRSSINTYPASSRTFSSGPRMSGNDGYSTTHHQNSLLLSSSSSASPSTDTNQVLKRIHNATSAVLRDDDSSTASHYSLSTEIKNTQDFAVALQLLQNNVICLCIRTGVPVAQLWPAEAMLLNLYALDVYCEQQTAVEY